LERVPCSKNDVFSTTLLSPMDKRRLMKFMQLALDYATAEGAQEESDATAAAAQEGGSGRDEGVHSLNERYLNQGRSLARPQNKVVSTDDIQLLRQCIAEDMDFETYLTEKQRLSPQLRSLVRYALTLESGRPTNSSGSTSSSPSTQEGMKNLCHHMQSLGRFGSTAFLVPVYGSGELPQAFCRSAAVYGATYLLRRAPLRILTTSTTGDDVNEAQSQSAVQGVILGGDDEEDGLAGKPVPKRKQVNCSHVIAPLESMMRPSKKRVLRQISILSGKPIRSSADQRHAIIFPPNSFGNSDTIHGLILDEKVNVVPHVAGGCCVIHLTTTVDDDAPEGASAVVDSGAGMLQEALDSIMGKDVPDVDEIYRVVFSYSLYDVDKAPALAANANSGLHAIHRPRPGLAADPAFEQAKQIFTRICPTVDFLAMSEAMDAAVKERLGDTHNEEEDDDKMVLESAMGIMDTPSEE
jgi:RAB protein geranylgeranyltransferase component A